MSETIDVYVEPFGVGGEVFTCVRRISDDVEIETERLRGLFEPTQDFGITEQL